MSMTTEARNIRQISRDEREKLASTSEEVLHYLAPMSNAWKERQELCRRLIATNARVLSIVTEQRPGERTRRSYSVNESGRIVMQLQTSGTQEGNHARLHVPQWTETTRQEMARVLNGWRNIRRQRWGRVHTQHIGARW